MLATGLANDLHAGVIVAEEHITDEQVDAGAVKDANGLIASGDGGGGETFPFQDSAEIVPQRRLIFNDEDVLRAGVHTLISMRAVVRRRGPEYAERKAMKSLLRSWRWMACVAVALGEVAMGQGAASRWTVAELTRRAEVIVAGEVMSVAWEAGAVTITVRVEEGLQGARSGELVTFREWAGLWATGQTRYRSGERLILFLHGARAQGLSSPVGGDAGVMRVHGDGTVLPADDVEAPRPLRARRLAIQAGRRQGATYREMVQAIAGAIGQPR
jgi:hypothetical protein